MNALIIVIVIVAVVGFLGGIVLSSFRLARRADRLSHRRDER